jgi:hypothetical protein
MSPIAGAVILRPELKHSTGVARPEENFLEISVGYELIYDCPQPTPMMLVLHIHYSRAADISFPII